jgi:hypothetical protein
VDSLNNENSENSHAAGHCIHVSGAYNQLPDSEAGFAEEPDVLIGSRLNEYLFSLDHLILK